MREEIKLGRIRRFRFLVVSPKQLLQVFHPEWCSSSPRLGMGRRWMTCKVPALLTPLLPLPRAGSQAERGARCVADPTNRVRMPQASLTLQRGVTVPRGSEGWATKGVLHRFCKQRKGQSLGENGRGISRRD